MTEPVESRLKKLEERVQTLEDLDDRVDGHDRDLELIRADLRGLKRELGSVRYDLTRLLDSHSAQGLLLQKVHGLLEQLVRQQTPSVEVSHG